MTLQVQSPFQQFFDLDGDPLDNGSIYIGNSGQNPQQYPIPIFWDAAGSIPALQPVKTLNGYAVRNGTPSRIWVENVDYSITVKDSRGRVVFTALSVTAVSFSALAAPTGSSLVGFIQAGAHAVARTVLDRGRDAVSIKDFANYSTNASQAILDMATDYGFVRIPFGDFPVGTSLTISVPIWFDEGASITAAGGITVTINNAIESPRQYIFKGTGTYSLGHSQVTDTGENARQIHVSWFGAFPSPDAGADQTPFIQKAFDSVGNGRESVVQFDIGNYNMYTGALVTRACWVRGEGQRRTVFKTTMDGFDFFTTSATGCRFSNMQFEIDLGVISTRTRANIVLNHDACDIYDVAMGQTQKGIVCNALRYRIRNVIAAYGSYPGANSSLVDCNFGQGHVADIYCLTSTFGPDSVVNIGEFSAGTVSDVLVENIDSVLPSKLVSLVATAGNIDRIMLKNIRYGGSAGTPSDQMIHMKTFLARNMTNVIIDGVNGTTFIPNCITLEQTGTGAIRTVSIDNVVRNGGSSGYGIGFIKGSGALEDINIGKGVMLLDHTPPFFYSGNPTRIKIDPACFRSANDAICYDMTLADDSATQIDLNRGVFTGFVLISAGVTNYGFYVVRAASSPAATTINQSANVGTALTPLTGTTGPDGRLTLGITDSVLYVENRLGGSQRISVNLLTGVI